MGILTAGRWHAGLLRTRRAERQTVHQVPLAHLLPAAPAVLADPGLLVAALVAGAGRLSIFEHGRQVHARGCLLATTDGAAAA
jgi:hypothetical protein